MNRRVNYWNSNVARRLEKDSITGVGMYNDEESFAQQASLIMKQDGFILDLGCGFGRLLYHMFRLKKDLSYVGIDSSEEMLKIAKRNFPYAIFIQKDILDLTTFVNLDETYLGITTVVINEVLIHLTLPQQEILLRNIGTFATFNEKIKHIFLSIQVGNPETQVIPLEGESFFNTVQSEGDFLNTIKACIPKVKEITMSRYPLVPGVTKVNLHVSL